MAQPRSDDLTVTPDHLSTDDLKEEVKAAEDQAVPKEDDPKLKPEYTFDFKWTDPTGKVWAGTFTNKILTIKERQRVGIMMARMSGGMPETSMDALTSELNMITAHLAFSLEDTEEPPEWAKDLRDLRYTKLVQALFREVQSHESTFHGFGQDQV